VHPSVPVSACVDSVSGCAAALEAVVLDADTVVAARWSTAVFLNMISIDECTQILIKQLRSCCDRFLDTVIPRDDILFTLDWLLCHVTSTATMGVLFNDLQCACRVEWMQRTMNTTESVNARVEAAECNTFRNSMAIASTSDHLLLQAIAIALETKSICVLASSWSSTDITSYDSIAENRTEDENFHIMIMSMMNVCFISTRFCNNFVTCGIGECDDVLLLDEKKPPPPLLPWMRLNGSVNFNALAMYSARILTSVAECPGMGFSSIHAILSPFFDEEQTKSLLDLLVAQGVLSREIPSCSCIVQNSAIWFDFSSDSQHIRGNRSFGEANSCYFVAHP
jgi:hypothetical protein